MTPAYTLHKLIRKDGPVEPQTVVELPKEEYVELAAVGAVREPTESELKLFEMTRATGQPAPVVADPAANVDETGQDVASDDRAALEAEAQELGIKFQKNTSDEKLRERITEAKAADNLLSE